MCSTNSVALDILERLRDAAQCGHLNPEQSDLYLQAPTLPSSLRKERS